ncbi:uncharacterized protein MYCGRDRAFT_38280 [Zymoseptoria tritici IPO323]|uniref:Major facilitator superfamily (MFS) profile domain-containing protein n=4 Tax=Zymoseptoria tritici TaxID=1047171 RepID=F9X6U1_ZYMTI|nr:uncharacterized protein MYCGRDRAFT_38280 [Zymoseptoria tritici IPO323]EGP88750.1 hypothetical protein MYCGRDRAFT_38280 [Zymoseptoria tritici IPO323]
MGAGWFYTPKQMLHYFATRFTTLRPPRTKLQNPYAVLRTLDRHEWSMLLVGFAAWTVDSFDYFTVPLTVTEIAKEFGEMPSAITWGITITLMLRSVGAVISGCICDRYGRKWIMIGNLALIVIVEMCSGFCNNLPQFIGVRALFGICMGGLIGVATTTALEDLPYESRGIASGIVNIGYPVGYLLATPMYRAWVPSHGWRSLFWFASGAPLLVLLWRLYLPETNSFQILKASREDKHTRQDHKRPSSLRAFLSEASFALRKNWVLFIYMVVLMTAFTALSHGGDDLYATFLKQQRGASPDRVTLTICIGQIGAIIGSLIFGWISSFIGRRLTVIVTCLSGGALVAPYVLVRGDKLIAVTFFQRFFNGAVWAPMAVHLIELSPPQVRAFFYGVTYQLGNLASAASSTIEATIGEEFPLPPSATGTKRYDYGKVIGIFMGAACGLIVILILLGPEMTQEERDEEALLVHESEEMRANGRSLAEIGRSRTEAGEKDSSSGDVEDATEKRAYV